MLVKSAQNGSISSEICPENSNKIVRFLAKLAPKIATKSADFFANLFLKIPLTGNLTFFPRLIRSPVNYLTTNQGSLTPISTSIFSSLFSIVSYCTA